MSSIDDWKSFDEDTKKEIERLEREDPGELKEAFSGTLAFGTAGMREKMGAGTNRLNRYTIRSATQGLANYLKESFPNEPIRVFISFDCRINSPEFALETARTLAGNGIEVYLTKELRPTPFVSFGCRYLKCHAAVMITASHNPRNYNGYKVYWADGAQVVAPHDKGIITAVAAITDQKMVHVAEENDPKIQPVPNGVEEAYFEELDKLQLYPADNLKFGDKLKVVYANLHGCGITLLPEVLKRWGFTQMEAEESQKEPNGEFPGTDKPNPEEREALKPGIEKLLLDEADILIACDPDADRIGLAARQNGKAYFFNGNEIATLLIYHILSALKLKDEIPRNGAVATTIVSTELFKAIAQSYDVSCFEVLTGFKYIGELIYKWERNDHTFLFGAEESHGYLRGTHARDKDAMIANALICETALQLKKEGMTLIDYLHEIYQHYGIFREKVLAYEMPRERIDQAMTHLRENPPDILCGQVVSEMIDHLKGGPLPPSNVITFRLDDESRFVIRPSGTEPKMKIYGAVHSFEKTDISEGIAALDKRLDHMLTTIKSGL